MTKMKKVLWRIAGIVPLLVFVTLYAFLGPVYKAAFACELYGTFSWFAQIFLWLIGILPFYFWSDYCRAREEEKADPGWQGFLQLFRQERKTNLLLLGFTLVLFILIVVINYGKQI